MFFSKHSNASDHVVCETDFAFSNGLPILIVRLDQTKLSTNFEYLLRTKQWIDVSHVSSDEERVAQIPSRIEAAFVKLKNGLKTAKAPIAMVFGDFEILADENGKPI